MKDRKRLCVVSAFIVLMLCIGAYADTIDLTGSGFDFDIPAGEGDIEVISFGYDTGGNNTTINFRRLNDDDSDSWMMPVDFTSTYIEVDSDYGPYRANIALTGENQYVFTLNRSNGLWTLSVNGEDVVFAATASTTNPQPDGNSVTVDVNVPDKYFSDESPESTQNAIDLGWTANAPDGVGGTGAYRLKFSQAEGAFITGLVFYKAYDPVPMDEGKISTDSNTATVDLSWTAGDYAASHDVYFGDTLASVNNATTASAEFKGNQPENSFNTGPLAIGEYFWRIDEVNGTDVWKGDVWSIEVRVMPEPIVWWEMNSEDDFNLGQDVNGFTGRLYVDNKATGELAAGMTAHADILFDPDEGAVHFDPTNHPWTKGAIYGEEDPNMVLTNRTQYSFSFFAKGDLDLIVGNGYAFYICYNESSRRFKADLGFLSTKALVFQTPDNVWSGYYHIWDPDPNYSDRYIDPEIWNHYAFVWDANSDNKESYVNGELRHTVHGLSPIPDDWTVQKYGFGDFYGWSSPGGWYNDFRIYDTALDAEAIQIMMGDFLLYPKSPSPKKKATDVDVDGTVLTWSAGIETAYQDIYFGTNESAVENADTSSQTYQGQIALENTFDPCGLELMETYYWRVDQLDANGVLIVNGPVWSFDTLECITVEDFESYDNEGNDVTIAWIDVDTSGAGDMQRFLAFEPDYPVLSPVNSLRLRYRLTAWGDLAYYAKTRKSFSPPQDWTAKGVRMLSVNYYGDAGNFGLPMFITVGDGTTEASVYVDADTLAESWNEANVSLAEVAAAGVDLTNITYMEIGFGDGTNQGSSSSQYDMIYVDDIALYPPKCVLSESSLQADITQDCVVNYDDLAHVTGGWLRGSSEDTITATGPVGLWLFDDDTDLTKATIGNDLVVDGSAPVAVAGLTAGDGAAQIGVGSYYKVNHGITADPTKVNEYTLLWELSVPMDSFTDSLQWIALCEYDTTQTTDADLSINIDDSEIGRFGANDTGYVSPTAPAEDLIYPEIYYQLVCSVKNGQFFNYYINGKLVLTGSAQAVDGRFGIESELWLFRDDAGEDLPLDCSTFAIWDRALTDAEVMSLVPIQLLNGDLNDDTAIDFADYSILAGEWLVEDLWP